MKLKVAEIQVIPTIIQEDDEGNVERVLRPDNPRVFNLREFVEFANGGLQTSLENTEKELEEVVA